jgi:hypothetical protein
MVSKNFTYLFHGMGLAVVAWKEEVLAFGVMVGTTNGAQEQYKSVVLFSGSRYTNLQCRTLLIQLEDFSRLDFMTRLDL